MSQNSPKTSQKVTNYFQKNNNKAIILGVFVVSFCFVIFGSWVYLVTFLMPKEPVQSEIMQKRLKIDSKKYEGIMQSLANDQESKALSPSTNPFK